MHQCIHRYKVIIMKIYNPIKRVCEVRVQFLNSYRFIIIHDQKIIDNKSLEKMYTYYYEISVLIYDSERWTISSRMKEGFKQ